MEHRDRITIWVAKRNTEVTDNLVFLPPEETQVNLVQLSDSMLLEITGQTDTGYAQITYPATRDIVIHKGDRVYLTKPKKVTLLANDADYEATSTVGKRYRTVTLKALS